MTRADPAGRLRRTRVTARTWITPQIIRITVGGDLDDFRDLGTDQHVALYFYPPEAVVPEGPLSPERLRPLHEFAMPQVRRYTIRRFHQATQEVDFDFVVHESAGPASAWALGAAVGDELVWWGPTPAWEPPRAGHLVMVGDETALPAIDATLAALPAQIEATVIAEVADSSDEAYLSAHRDTGRIIWIRRGTPTGEVDEDLAAAVRDLPSSPGPAAVWAGTEFRTAGFLRRWFLGERGMTKDQAHIVTYWIHGQPQDMRPDRRNRQRNLDNRAADPGRAARFLRPVP